MLHDLVDGFDFTSLADKAIRTVAVYGAVLLLLRLAGKRQLAQLSSFDFVVLLLLSNVVQNAIIGPDNTLIGGLIGAVILIVGNFLLVFFAFLNPRIENDLRGRPTTLVENGRLQRKNLRRELISDMELEAGLRRQGYDGTGAVEEVVLQPEGALVVTPKERATLDDVLAALERLEHKLDQRA
jgi:uncharacterized membrane protein YcaP (DUF421 family)